MADTNGAQKIIPALAGVMGQEIQIVAYCDPDQFPAGLEFAGFIPGGLAPLGKILVQPGTMLAVLPEPMANQLMTILKQQNALAKGGTAAPGVRG